MCVYRTSIRAYEHTTIRTYLFRWELRVGAGIVFPVTLPPLLPTLRMLRSSAEVLGSLGLPANTKPNRHAVMITASFIIEKSVEKKGYDRYGSGRV